MNKEIKERIETIKKCEVPDGFIKGEVGLIPVDWKTAVLNDISEIITKTAGKGIYETVSISAGVGFVNQAKKFGKELSGKQYEKYIVLYKGDFSYNKGNSKTYPQGCIYRLKDRETAAVPNVFESFRIKSGCADYFDHLFTSGFFNKQLSRKINHGVRDDGLLNLTGKDFYSCVLPFPPVKEQEKIAEILSRCDTVIEECEKQVEEYKSLKKTCLSKMFPKKGSNIPEIRFPGFTDAWEQRKVQDVADRFDNLRIPVAANLRVHGTTPYYGANGIQDYVDGFTHNGEFVLVAEDGANDLKNYPVKCVNGCIWVNNHAHVLQGKLDIADNNFLAFAISQSDIASLLVGGGRAKLNAETLMNVEFRLPCLQEQYQIGEYFTRLDHLITLHQRKVNAYTQMKKALTQLLLTGIVRANKQKEILP